MDEDKKPLLVIAEDQPDALRAMKMLFKSEGFAVIPCADGQEAHDQIKKLNAEGEHLTALITDISMPRMGGKELAEKVRHEEGLPHDLAIMVVSALPEDSGDMMKKGLVDSAVVKPVDFPALMTELKRMIDTKKANGIHPEDIIQQRKDRPGRIPG